jgi:BirA family biotin operon repressor/biotin-[acetyl-CoA-carboxylase] ligase
MPVQLSQPSESSSFNLAEVEAAIASTQFARHLHHLASTPSTNGLAHQAAESGARHGVWIADEQTAGRGRGAHTWHSEPGTSQAPAGLYMTALIASPIPMQSALRLSFTTAIAVQSSICSVFGFQRPAEIDIRWPNDLILNGRKVGGILIDTASKPAAPPSPAMLRYAIVGIGINLNHTSFPPELESIATSLRRELEDDTKCFRREPLAAAILVALDEELQRLISNLEPRTLNLAAYSTWLSGKRVRVEAREPAPNDPAPGGYTGTTAGLDPNGFLRVLGDDGQLRTVLSGGLREP